MKSTFKGRLVVLDLDGTITKSDTLIPFLIGCFLRHPRFRMRLLFLPLDVLCFALKRFDSTEFKERLLITFIGGLSVESVDSWSRRFASRVAVSGCRQEALLLIGEARQKGDRLLVLSASPEIYVRHIARNLGIDETICTRIEVRSGKYTGRLLGKNCKGKEKLRRLRDYLGSEKYEGFTVAFGNAESDRSVLEWADQGWLLRSDRLVGLQPLAQKRG